MEKVALIIGAGDAIGSAIARKFSERGLTVCATRRNEDKLQPLISEITAAGGKRMVLLATHEKRMPPSLYLPTLKKKLER